MSTLATHPIDPSRAASLQDDGNRGAERRKSIRQKLVIRVCIILVLAFIATLATVAHFSITNTNKNLMDTEKQITESLIAKGIILTQNNSESMRGLAEDNAFGAIRELISSTVVGDPDIIYGVFFDSDLMPWALATDEQPEGAPQSTNALTDDNSIWGSQLTRLDHRLSQLNGEEVYLFSSPVIIEDETVGSIQYGLSTRSLRNALTKARDDAQKDLITTLTVLLALAALVLIIAFNAIRSMASKITAPLIDLKKSAETISQGNYDTAVDIHSDDEIGELADNFNLMRKTIQKKIQDLGEINTLGELMTATSSQAGLCKIIASSLTKQCHAQHGAIYLMRNDKIECALWKEHETLMDAELLLQFTAKNGALASSIASIINEYKRVSAPTLSTIKVIDALYPSLLVPISDGSQILGFLLAWGQDNIFSYTPSDNEFHASIANMAAVNLRNIQMRNEIEEHNKNLEAKVKERTAALQEKTNDILNMMENMHQGLFTITQNGAIHPEYSKYLEDIFNTTSISDKNYQELLFKDAKISTNTKDQVIASIDSMLGSDEMMFSFNSHLLVSEIDVSIKGVEKILQLDWDPILNHGSIDKIMVTVRDVTELKALEKAAQAQKEELELVGQVLAVEASKFNEFIASARELLNKNLAVIQSSPTPESIDLNLLFRNMHTIKGNSRTYALAYITDCVHDAETLYDEIRKGLRNTWDPQTLVEDIALIRSKVERYHYIHETVLKRTDSSHEKTLSTAELKSIQKAVSCLKSASLSAQPQSVASELEKILIKIDYFRLSDVIDDKKESLAAMAQQLSKAAPLWDIADSGIYLENSTKDIINGVFMHSLRNAIDHGIETPEERLAAGKAPQGTISLRTHIDDSNFLVINLQDDGRGINLTRLAEKAIASGLIKDSKQQDPSILANLIFASGLSTAESVTSLSGRGVGMDAVKQYLTEMGGNAKVKVIELLPNGYCLFSLEITIPPAHYRVLN
jgi:HAMP domain-containing protein/signal transduction histidine kinase